MVKIKKNKAIVLLSIIVILITNLLPFYTNAPSVMRLNIVGETVVTYLAGPIYVISIVIIENAIKTKIGLFDTFINYTLVFKLVNIMILYAVILGFKTVQNKTAKQILKEDNTTKKIYTNDASLIIIVSACIQIILSKYISNRISGIFIEDAYLNTFRYYLSIDVIKNSIYMFLLSAIISIAIIKAVKIIVSCTGKQY